jgi:hypothetical protein
MLALLSSDVTLSNNKAHNWQAGRQAGRQAGIAGLYATGELAVRSGRIVGASPLLQ